LSEFLSRRQFLRRVAIGGALAVSGGADMTYNGIKLVEFQVQLNQAKKETIEQGIIPPVRLIKYRNLKRLKLNKKSSTK
jgi:hypothetical protein